eukprot:1192090-Prorocentrum_minimum.AAC.1
MLVPVITLPGKEGGNPKGAKGEYVREGTNPPAARPWFCLDEARRPGGSAALEARSARPGGDQCCFLP